MDIPSPLGVDLGALSLAAPGKSRCGDAVGWHEREGVVLAVAADGVGSRACDFAASAAAVEAARGSCAVSDDPVAIVTAAFNAANEAVRDLGIGPCRGMRTTLVVALWSGGDRVWVGSVGDSRAYHVALGRADPDIVTEDDVGFERVPPSLRHLERAEGRPLFREGLTRSVGQARRLDVDVREVEFRPGESLVLATDGMWSAPRFRDVLLSCTALDLQEALGRWDTLQRDDDASVVILRRTAQTVATSLGAALGAADVYVSTVAAWTELDLAVARSDWPGVTSAALEAADRSLRFGRYRLIGLADRIALMPGATRVALEAVVGLIRAGR